MSALKLPWQRLMRLHVVRNLIKLLARRWNLEMSYVDDPCGGSPKASQHTFGTEARHALPNSAVGFSAGAPPAEPILSAMRQHSEQIAAHGFLVLSAQTGLPTLVAPVCWQGETAGALVASAFLPPAIPDSPTPPSQSGEWSASPKERAPPPPLSADELSLAGELLASAAEEITTFLAAQKPAKKTTHARAPYPQIIGDSPSMQKLYDLLDRVVASDSTVLIQGENGTGKELVARAIHQHGPRAKERFVVQNCSALNDNLLESELFGHKRGAFTGAVNDKMGLFEVANHGTFFLDEIGEMSPALQVKLLRTLQEGTLTPLGSTNEKQVDVRIIAATNRDLQTMTKKGEFREDLYYRINVINLLLPPLRKRKQDIPLLVDFCLKKDNAPKAKNLTPKCMERLLAYDWPGNVRELENEMERLLILGSDHESIDDTLLSERIVQANRASSELAELALESMSLPRAVHALEKRMILAALRRNHWNKTRAAAELQVSRRTFLRLVQKYEIVRK